MRNKTKPWIVAIVLGIVFPAFMYLTAEYVVYDSKSSTSERETSQSTEPKPDQTKESDMSVYTIPVELEDQSVQVMDLEEYLLGVVLAEMPAGFEPEALKAQAVVARTYALKRNTAAPKHLSNAVCTKSNCCQAYCEPADYPGTEDDISKVKQAVRLTHGQVLTYNGELIEATYFSCSGGKTEDAQVVWGAEVPYLKSVESPGEESALHYIDSVTFQGQDLARLLELEDVDYISIGAVSYTDGGGVEEISICGKAFKGTELREKLSLRSTAFTIASVGDNVIITTKGYGHRVGLSQYGADAMAVKGSTYSEILEHYYPGTVIETIENN